MARRRRRSRCLRPTCRMDRGMRIKLDKRWVDFLRSVPESGMGYQRVDVKTADRRELKNAIVLNCELLEVPDGSGPMAVSDLRLHDKASDDHPPIPASASARSPPPQRLDRVHARGPPRGNIARQQADHDHRR